MALANNLQVNTCITHVPRYIDYITNFIILQQKKCMKRLIILTVIGIT